jgi:signal transduction histidine kinase
MGYRARMTLAFAVLSLASVLLLTLVFLNASWRELKSDRMMSVERMTACLAGNLYWDLKAGDGARLGESLERFARGVPAPTPPAVLVLDGQGAVTAQRGGADLTQGTALAPEPASELAEIGRRLAAGAVSGTAERDTGFLAAATIGRDGQVLGTVLVDYPLATFRRHFISLFETAVGSGLVLLALLLALGWLMGRGLMRPIARLRECMRRVGRGDLDVNCGAVQSRDEVGELARGFDEMLAGLRDKRLLEEEMRHSKRLAAVGQLAAGVAHEINNPLGGMLNAINTFKRHGTDPAVTAKTMDLLERGLRQIQSTVQALLVQARAQARTLSAADLQDVRTLVHAELGKKGLRLQWDCALADSVPLPSGAVRQVTINLLLNAIQAAPQGGTVRLRCGLETAHLWLRVEDDGPGIAPEARAKLFEPFYSSTGGSGLGLWVTYQTVAQLGGSIEPMDLAPGTAMEVRLPFVREEAAA